MRWPAKALIALFVTLLFLHFVAPRGVAAALNGTRVNGPYAVSDADRALAKAAVDLHADPLLWGRNLLSRGRSGHVDLPRLQQAGAALQVFGVVTQAPRHMRLTHNSRDDFDLVTALAVSSLWPRPAWTSRLSRALFEARRLREFCRQSDGALRCVRSRDDLETLLADRARGSDAVGAVLALEGSQALEGKLENVGLLYEAGFRMMAPAHFTDTEISGSAHGDVKGGLSPLGLRWLRELEARHVIVDLAHASPQTFTDVLRLAKRPVVVSHTGVKATCDNPRNLTDDQLRAVANNGGLIGIGYWDAATCGKDAGAIARAVRHARDVAGIAHVALGSDFDGAVWEPFDAAGVPLLVPALRKEQLGDDEIRAVLSGNATRFLLAALPGGH